MKTKLIKQRNSYDCMLACLTMHTGRAYDDMFLTAFCEQIETERGAFGDTLTSAFAFAGLIRNEDYKLVYAGNGSNIAPHVLRDMLWKRRAIIQAPSLNFFKGEHAVYWTGDEILDPSELQVYRWIENMSPTYVWIFND